MYVLLIIISFTSSGRKRILYGSSAGPVKNFFHPQITQIENFSAESVDKAVTWRNNRGGGGFRVFLFSIRDL
jgi:hypothetical protein